MKRDLAALAEREWDVVVVGAGIHGAAFAWDAAQRGLAVALVEVARLRPSPPHRPAPSRHRPVSTDLTTVGRRSARSA